MKCPCHSDKQYDECCKPFHEGKALPQTATQLMRSRYSAFALNKVNYLNETSFQKSCPHSYKDVQFENLKILESMESDDMAYVTFRATLKQQGRDLSFTEKSLFYKVEDRWIYHSGQIL